MIGVDPGPFTLRQLIWMTESREKSEWRRAASIMATLVNIHRGRRQVSPEDLMPFKRRVVKTDVSVLKEVLRGRNG